MRRAPTAATASALVYVGLQMLRESARAAQAPTVDLRGRGFHRIFAQGLLTNALNPKVAIFFLAFLPQFIDADAPSKVTAFVCLGLLFNATGTAWNMLVALMAGRMARSTHFGHVRIWLDRTLGALFVVLGVRL